MFGSLSTKRPLLGECHLRLLKAEDHVLHRPEADLQLHAAPELSLGFRL